MIGLGSYLNLMVTASSLLVVISLSLLNALADDDGALETSFRACILMTCGLELIVASIAIILVHHATDTRMERLNNIMYACFYLGIVTLFAAVCLHEVKYGLDGVWVVILVMGILWLCTMLYALLMSAHIINDGSNALDLELATHMTDSPHTSSTTTISA